MARTMQVGPRSGRVSRLRQFANMNLGVKMLGNMRQNQEFRKDDLDVLDQYYEGSQYDDLQDWEDALDSDDYVSIRKRKPRILFNVAKLVVDKVAAKLMGKAVFPTFVIEDDPDDTTFFATVVKAANLRRNLMDPIKHLLVSGSVFVRYFLVNGNIQIEWANAKFCYPVFDAMGNLAQLEIKYVYEDENDKDSQGEFRKKWYRLILTKTSDTLYDNPEYRENVEPQFAVVNTNNHGLGWVQGEWLRTARDKFNPDGAGIYSDPGVMSFMDDLNYSLSQSSQAVGYNQDPQITVNNVDEDELETLIRSSQKAWNLGREGEAKYLETSLDGVKEAREQRDEMRERMFNVLRIVIHDPDKMGGDAQSGTALELLHAPLLELIDELRAMIEGDLSSLVIKIGLTCLIMNAKGLATVIEAPAGYMPGSLDIMVQWPAIFPPTLTDMQAMATVAQTLTQANIVSRETMTRWIATMTNIIDNVDEELEKIAAQPVMNPFGDSGFGGFGDKPGGGQ